MHKIWNFNNIHNEGCKKPLKKEHLNWLKVCLTYTEIIHLKLTVILMSQTLFLTIILQAFRKITFSYCLTKFRRELHTIFLTANIEWKKNIFSELIFSVNIHLLSNICLDTDQIRSFRPSFSVHVCLPNKMFIFYNFPFPIFGIMSAFPLPSISDSPSSLWHHFSQLSPLSLTSCLPSPL